MNAENPKAAVSCATKLPWHENPFRLISWLEMNEFSAHLFVNIGASVTWMEDALDETGLEGNKKVDRARKICVEFATRVAGMLDSIGCKFSAKGARRLASDSSSLNAAGMRVRAREFKAQVFDEMSSHLFLWVPAHRAEWFGKNADAILGSECCTRFPSIQREVEEAMRCYAVGRYTASAFHLMRAAEVGVKALAKAIKAAPKHDAWRLVFNEMRTQVAPPPENRQKHWKTHGEFLETIWADMRVVSKEWRNDLAHSVDTYSEEEAKQLLGVIPVFLRHLATKMDENGTLY